MRHPWGTGHSLGAGVLGGLLLASHVWTIAVVAFVLGVTVGLGWRLLAAGGEAVRRFTTRRNSIGRTPW
jgi:hypothetical protein